MTLAARLSIEPLAPGAGPNRRPPRLESTQGIGIGGAAEGVIGTSGVVSVNRGDRRFRGLPGLTRPGLARPAAAARPRGI